MTLERFLRERGEDWHELEQLIESSGGRGERLQAAGVRRLGELYRAAAADLAFARRRFPSDPVRPRLEALVSRGGMIVYESRPRTRSIGHFFLRAYWRRVAERPGVLALAWALLLVPGALAFAWALTDPGSAIRFVPSEFRQAADPATEAGTSAAEESAFAAFLFTHNIQVTFLAFALGITAGIGTAIVVANNGLLLGAIAGLAVEAGNGRAFAEFIAPHAPLELSCIVVTSAAGIRLGWALVDPGPESRSRALAAEGRRAVMIVLGTMPWLVLAGILEAFVRGSGIGLPALLATGLLSAGGYWALVWRLGRERPDHATAAERGLPAAPVTAAPAPSP